MAGCRARPCSDLQNVLELAISQRAQVAAVRDHAVGLRLQLLKQTPVVTAREVLQNVGLFGVRLDNGDASVQARDEVRVDERRISRAERAQIMREIRSVQRTMRSGGGVQLHDLCGHVERLRVSA
jgi:hypothetical protein